jgi:hypothetical protein
MLIGKLPFEATSVQETMIKRLTDEPIKLVEARPDLSFPAGLQPVLDTALARTPMERYQSVAKFAADVAAVTGQPTTGGGAVPHTRSMGDTEGKTQLLTPISAASAPRKKRSLIPVVAGVVVILAGGGAWVALNGGSKANPNPADSSRNVAQNTAKDSGTRQTDGVRTVGTQSATLANRETGQRTRPPAPPPPASRYDDASGRLALDQLADPDVMDNMPGEVLVDSAKAIYRAAVADTAKAYAAYVIAQLYVLKVKDSRNAHAWISTALRFAPSNKKYQGLRTAIDQDMQRQP